ncbi:uncharacterized protein LOC129577275 isoform X2 [Sitodiplosis mosellana]|uniref:uncharacterized protein LOC129577275 isoform X2 n=1 Tax=Sitodiplosis mosellana TaxID=263140 RepID=UPI0024443FA1|nr:uncharacterized protein LOC129577275 isoform X2 [Sitodiplosis mosellana]
MQLLSNMRSKQITSSTVLLVIALVTVVRAQFHHPSQFRSQAVVNSGFIPSIQQEDDDKLDDSTPSAAINYRQPAPSYEYEEEEEERPTTPNQIRRQQSYPIRSQQAQPSQNRQSGPPPSKNRFEDELETEEPDRLALALEKSTFQCEGRTGYYADESVNCEVFHYCQENQKHSWVCPEGFQFHQVHLICMPPSNDNACQQSSKYHIVNDFLYKPINVEEHQTRPNVTLRYSERYYPEDVYRDERQEEDDEENEEYRAREYRQRQPVNI